MDFLQASTQRKKKNSPLFLSVLNCPPKNQLKQILSPSTEFSLFQYEHKKMILAAFQIQIPKSKLLSNLEIYEWRYQTQFPIVKTIFVNVKQNQTNSLQIIKVTPFIEHCPLKLTQIYQLSLSQSLYLLKQSLIGFQRLFNRFGGFEVLNSMIAINQKGYCKVWINENFALNSFPKKDINQNNMVNKIITIIQSHSQDSRGSKKLFNQLQNSSTFLDSLKAIQQFVKKSKLIVPYKFVSNNVTKQKLQQPPRLIKTFHNLNQIATVTRFSVKQERVNKMTEAVRQQLNNIRNRKHSYSPLVIKKMQSQQKIIGPEALKVSDGQTAYTKKNNRTSNMQSCQMSPKIQPKRNDGSHSYSPKKRPRWMEESSYVMQQMDLGPKNKCQSRIRKELSHSLAIKHDEDLLDSSRKYSCRLGTQNRKKIMDSKYPYFSKKSVDAPYFAEFCELLDREDDNKDPNIEMLQTDQEKIRQNKCGVIIKNNGWVQNVSGLLNIVDQLQYSFDNGQEQKIVNKGITLEKLAKLGRQQMSKSVLPQQLK